MSVVEPISDLTTQYADFQFKPDQAAPIISLIYEQFINFKLFSAAYWRMIELQNYKSLY